jgi:membrane protein implicated in regulation of membrane protease activity
VSFESRHHRFVYICDVSVLNERVWGFLRVRHMFYLFLAVIFLWCDYSACSLMILVMGTVAGALALLSGLFPRGFVVMLIYSTLLSNYSK